MQLSKSVRREERDMGMLSQAFSPELPVWNWPLDDQTPVDITPYYVSKYPKGGLSYWVGVARSIGPTAQDWELRRRAPIVYLLKVGSDAIHERLYYALARALNLPIRCVCSCAMNWARCFKMSSSPRCFPGEDNQRRPAFRR